MVEQLTVELPEELARRARALAAATQRRFEDAIVDWIGRAVDEPEVLSISNELLLQYCDLTMAAGEQTELSELLDKQREHSLDASERQRLDQLLENYRRGLLLKAKALNEAVARGLRPRLGDHAA